MAARLGLDIDGCGAELLRPSPSWRLDEEVETALPAPPLSWKDSEYGEPPSAGCSYAEYCKSVAAGNISRFKELEEASAGWWTPLLDRGSGGLLHIAADHGQLEMCRFLLEERGAEVNQQDTLGWTPLHRCARMAHSRTMPHLDVFQLLLRSGADASILTYECWNDGEAGLCGLPQSIYDVCTDKGLGWVPGRLRRTLRLFVHAHREVPKRPLYRYTGHPVGPAGARAIRAWAAIPKDSFLPYPNRGLTPSEVSVRNEAARHFAENGEAIYNATREDAKRLFRHAMQ